MKLNDIIKGIEITNSVSDGSGRVAHYDFTIVVFENTFKFESVEGDNIDVLCLEGESIYMENLYDMYFLIDGVCMALGYIFRQVNHKAYLLAEQHLDYEEQEEAEEDEMRGQISSVYYTGRV